MNLFRKSIDNIANMSYYVVNPIMEKTITTCSDYYYNFRGKFNKVLVTYKPTNQNMIDIEMQDVLDITITEFGPIPNDYILIHIEHIDNVMTDEDLKLIQEGWDIIEREDKITELEITIDK